MYIIIIKEKEVAHLRGAIGEVSLKGGKGGKNDITLFQF